MVQVHASAATLALLIGPWIFLFGKGNKRHRLLGYVFVSAMLLVNLTAFTIYELTGGPNLFHVLALVSLTTVCVGLYYIRRGDVAEHRVYMSWAYAGLLIALVTRLAPYLPLPFWASSLTLISVAYVLAYLVIQRAFFPRSPSQT